MSDDPIRRRDVARLLAGQALHGLAALSAAAGSLSDAATASFASLQASASSASTSGAGPHQPILGRGPDASMWVRARAADPEVASIVEVVDGTALLRRLREGDIGNGPILAPLTVAAIAGTARTVASMEGAGRTNAVSATADLIRRARPASRAVRVALARSAPILASEEPGAIMAASLDRIADELAAELRVGSIRLAELLDPLASTDVYLVGAWSRQSLGDPWLVEALLRNRQRTVVVARDDTSGEGDLVAGWMSPELRARTEPIPAVAIAATLRTRRRAAVLLLAEDVRRDGAIAAAPGSLAAALIAQHYDIPVFGVDLVSAFAIGSMDRPADFPVDLLGVNPANIDVVPAPLIAQTFAA